MTKTFFPRTHKFVEASKPHPDNTQYKISFGIEDWQGSHVEVVKIQMVYNGVVSGRRSPSYPIGTDDYTRVKATVEELIKNEGLEL